MKNNLFKLSLTNVLLAAVLFMISCGETPQNKPPVNTPVNNAANNTANNTANNNANQSDPGIVTEDCSEDKIKKVKDGMDAKINAKNSLKFQLKKNYDFKPVLDDKGDVVLYIWGKLLTDAKDLDELNKTYKGFLKKQCVTKIIFDQEPTTKTLKSGFEYELCEAPNEVCSNGSCQEPQNCPVK